MPMLYLDVIDRPLADDRAFQNSVLRYGHQPHAEAEHIQYLGNNSLNVHHSK